MSPLALWQARFAARGLRSRHLSVQLVPVRSAGDKDLARPLYSFSQVGVFAKEVQAAVLDGRADVAVHSCKDVPTEGPEDLCCAAALPRHDARDSLIGAADVWSLPAGAVVGSSSLRRRSQLAALRPDLVFADIRGNLARRISMVTAGDYSATLLAHAGLRRLGWGSRGRAIPLSLMVPAPGQGAVVLECRRDNRCLRRALAACEHRPTRGAIDAEREVLAALQGGCSLPLGCHVRSVSTGRWLMNLRLGLADGGLWRFDAEGRLGELVEAARRCIDEVKGRPGIAELHSAL